MNFKLFSCRVNNSVLRVWSILSSLFSLAYHEEWIQINPMDRATRPTPRKDEVARPVGALTEDEAVELLECIQHETYQWQCFIRLLLDTGCRKGELVGLLWRDVDFEHNTIKISNCLEYTPRKGVYNTTPKNRQYRPIDVDPEIMEMLRHLPEHQRVPSEEGYVFVGRNAPHMHPDTPTEHFRKFRKKYGFDLLTPHTLRHTVATISLDHNVPIANVSRRLGHSKPSVTLDIYTHPDQDGIKRAGDAYRGVLRRKLAERS